MFAEGGAFPYYAHVKRDHVISVSASLPRGRQVDFITAYSGEISDPFALSPPLAFISS